MKMATCHPDREHQARGLCLQCYGIARYAANKERFKAYSLAYYASHREERLAYATQHGAIYRAAHREQKAVYRDAHREEIRASNAAYRAIHREQRRAWHVAHREQAMARYWCRKLAVLNAYGGPRCSCCGETLVQGLTIDHMNGDGATWRKEHKREGTGLYRWLQENNYPPGFQVLCFTCNFAKGTGDHCPHQDLNPNPQE